MSVLLKPELQPDSMTTIVAFKCSGSAPAFFKHVCPGLSVPVATVLQLGRKAACKDSSSNISVCR